MAEQQTPQAALDAVTAALAELDASQKRDAELAAIKHPTAGESEG